jgi:FtsP/CotA-like multicopper oxidase with cupredoxin domain
MNIVKKIAGVTTTALLLATIPLAAFAKIDGISGPANPTFNFTAMEGHITTGEGNSIPFWGYADTDSQNPINGTVQYPGPTLIVNEGDTVTIVLTNKLEEPTSMVFPGLDVQTVTAPVFTQGAKGKLTSIVPEAVAGGTKTYVFTANRPGTFYYQSGSNQPVQLRMGMYGAIIVRPVNTLPKTYTGVLPGHNNNPTGDGLTAASDPTIPPGDRRFTKFAYNEAGVPDTVDVGTPPVTISNIGASTGYDREFMFLLSDMDPYFQMWMDLYRDKSKHPVSFGDWIDPVQKKDFTTWFGNYFFINGRNAPDIMGTAFDPTLPNQPYNSLVLFHPGEVALTRFLNLGRDFHPLHTHGNHQRIIAEDGLITSSAANPFDQAQTSVTGADLSTEEFTLTMSAGNTFDSLFIWTGQKLGWDPYNHQPGDAPAPYEYLADHVGPTPVDPATCNDPTTAYGRCANNQFLPPLANGTTGVPHDAPTIFSADQLTFTFGPWFSGSQYIGSSMPLPPNEVSFNYGGVSYYFMWHSHAERELTNFNIFPGGMLNMAGIVPWNLTLPAE